METNQNREDTRNQELDELLTTALKSESVNGLPFEFAAMVTRKAFAPKIKPFGIKTYALILLLMAIIVACLITLLSFINSELVATILAVLKPAKYIIGFILISLFLIEYIDQKLISQT